MTSRPRVKICGLRDAATIQAMEGLPFHELGFVFAPSKRQVTAEQAAVLIETAGRMKTAEGAAPVTVGVFVNTTLEELRDVLATAPLDVVQLHGEESPELSRSIREGLGVKVWKAFPALATAEGSKRLAAYAGAVDAVLVDTAGGGTGQTFDWKQVAAYEQAAAAIGVPLYIAGGLHPGNVGELLSDASPAGIDVSSGVEKDGVKDISKITMFLRKVLEA
ncbi:phosphoribosylanthranilate isomerase [Paenibacillus sp. GCM10023252]|uniref:phosphoribosylanthranilate isomerase n=1 Tax=Paenibacillus sp. GCM10023252 TaxID=3252649 RepID=UPI003619F760